MLFYSPQKKKVFVSTNATFFETDYMKNYKPCNKVVLEELLSDHIRPQLTIVVERKSEEATSPRRSRRIIRPSTHYRDIGEARVTISDNEQDDLLTYQHTIKDPDKEKWQNAMNLEMESMYSNFV